MLENNSQRLDIETDLMQGTIYKPEFFNYQSDDPNVELIPALALERSASSKIVRRAEIDAELAKKDLDGEFAQQIYDAEFDRRLIYWAVVYGLAVKEKPAYQFYDPETGVKLNLNHVINYVENKTDFSHHDFEELGLAILEKSGLDSLLKTYEQEEEA